MPSTTTKEKPKTHITVQREDVEKVVYMLEKLEKVCNPYNEVVRRIINFIKHFLLGENI